MKTINILGGTCYIRHHSLTFVLYGERYEAMWRGLKELPHYEDVDNITAILPNGLIVDLIYDWAGAEAEE